jgi:hypothetical protein
MRQAEAVSLIADMRNSVESRKSEHTTLEEWNNIKMDFKRN